MNVLRRGGAALLLVVSALGVVLCLGALVGVWVVRQPVQEAVVDTVDTLDGYLLQATQSTQQASDRFARLRATLDGARRELVEGGDAARGAIAARVAAAVQETRATVATLRDVVQTVSNGVRTLNRTLARLPSIVPPTLLADLQALEGRLSGIGGQVDALEVAMSDVSVGLARLTDALGTISSELQAMDDPLDQWRSRLDAARSSLGSTKATLTTAIDLLSVGLSLLLVLFAAGQASLCVQARRWLQTA